jgi:CheY-like chemotaxis protein
VADLPPLLTGTIETNTMNNNGTRRAHRSGRTDRVVHPVRGHVLFVDDDPTLAALVQLMLTRLDCRVTICTESAEALRLFRAQPHRFDMVITDQVMPGLTGTDLAAQVRTIRPDVPVVLCTGGNHHTPEMVRTAGISAILTKPLTSRSLASLLHRMLRTHR